MKNFVSILLVFIMILGGVIIFKNRDLSVRDIAPRMSSLPQVSDKPELLIAEPIDNALSRITKKPFSIYVNSKNSPVNPEHFTGFHTGTDFEIFPDEKNKEIEVRAICTGNIISERYSVKGYGGVKVQECTLKGEEVTVIYGHLKTEYKTQDMKQQETRVEKGKRIGFLGDEYSEETSGERKHLHLGIHKGKTLTIKGYVQDKSELEEWIDVKTLLTGD